MTFSELVAEVAREAKLSRAVVSDVLRAFSTVCRRVLVSDADVRLRGFGVFYSVALKGRPLFGGTRRTGGRRLIRFRESRHG